VNASDDRVKANSAVLIGAYMIIWEGKTAVEAYAPFAGLGGKEFMPFRDASYWPSEFDITVLDTLKGIYKGFTLGWIDFKNFDVAKYEYYEAVETGA
jgi:cell division cycle 14